jgi:RimJ/RimL family protein N-acetyltransferase
VQAAAEHAFANGIARVEAHVRLGNTASERVLERLEFKREGVRRRFLRHEGQRVDATLFCLLAPNV